MQKKILIVDDNRAVCSTVAGMLSGTGETLEVYNAADAIGLLDRHDIDVAIVDLLLSGPLSSDAVLQHAKYKGCRVITMSGTLSSDLRGRDLAAPHLIKPFSTQQLVSLVETTLTSRDRPAVIL